MQLFKILTSFFFLHLGIAGPVANLGTDLLLNPVDQSKRTYLHSNLSSQFQVI